ncbi:hypothetical protein [Sinomicrobium sp. M5D2P9]
MSLFDRFYTEPYIKLGNRLLNVLIVLLMAFNVVLALLAFKVHSYLMVVAHLFDGGTEIHGTRGPAILLYLIALANILMLFIHLMARIYRTDSY